MRPLRSTTLTVASNWGGSAVAERDVTTVRVAEATGGGLIVEIDAPFRGDAAPASLPGPTDRLYEFEVVELFLAAAEHPERYLEVELSPHGHHFVLRFEGVRNAAEKALQIPYTARIEGERWRGAAFLAAELLPPGECTANAFALSGPAGARRHSLAHPLPGARPNFHQPEAYPPLFPDR
jgi:hypothetical protein